MSQTSAELLFDHYRRFLGPPAARAVYRAADFDTSIQVLRFDGVFERCTTLATLGVGRLAARSSSDFVEVLLVVDDAPEDSEHLLVHTLFAMVQTELPIRVGMSVGGPAGVPKLSEPSVLKSGFYFAEPFPLPAAFRSPDAQSRIILAVPITAAEHRLVKQYGGPAFEGLLEANEVDPFEIGRPSAC